MLITVSLVTFNGMRWLPACLEAVATQTHGELEVIVFDNASTDGSVAWLRSQADAGLIRLIQSNRNLGYAAGHNLVIAESTGDLICLLNQDCILAPPYLAEAAAAFETSPRLGAVQGRVYRLGPDIRPTTVVDTTGLQIYRNRRVVSRSQGTLDGGPSEAGPVFGADGPCPVYRRAAIEDVAVPGTAGEIEYLDGDFFAYKEDIDLAWRLQLAAWDAAYVPTAIAWHARSAAEPARVTLRDWIAHRRATPGWIRRISWRNHRLMQVKNEIPSQYLRDIGPIAIREVASMAMLAVVDVRDLVAIVDMIRLLPTALRKRHLRTKRPSDGSRLSRWLV